MNVKKRKHIHTEDFPVRPERLFALLVTPSAIRSWWGAARVIVVPEAQGIWAATWGDREDDPDYVTAATIRLYQPPERMVLDNYRYVSKEGPLPFEAELTTEFEVASTSNGASLQVSQDGFPADSSADAFYSACQKGWEATFAGIRRFLSESPGRA